MKRGIAVMEMLVALAVLTVGAGIVVQIATWSLQQRIKLENQDRALRLAENALEDARLVPFDQLTPEYAAKITLPAAVLEHYPTSTIFAKLDTAPNRKSLAVTVTVRGGKPVTLTAWYQP